MTGMQLRKWRKKRKLSQEKLARLLDLSANTIARYERGVMPVHKHLPAKLREVKP
jgi:transcriptional regulator with XRE-family HTH domain